MNNHSIIRTEEGGVEFFTVEATGESGMSVRGLAIASGVSQQSVSKLTSNIPNRSPVNEYIGKNIFIDNSHVLKRGGIIKLLKIEFCASVFQYYSASKNPQTAITAKNSLNKLLTMGIISVNHLAEIKNHKDYRKESLLKAEAKIRNILANKLKGAIEVPCIAGRIDILTDTELIEVKKIEHWKAAIGQVLVYSHYFPTHQKRIHLFGYAPAHYLKIITEHCDYLNIKATFHEKDIDLGGATAFRTT